MEIPHLPEGMLKDLKEHVVFVPMDKTGYVLFGANWKGIGTANLAGCSVVIIASPLAALMTHIPPHPKDRPPTREDPLVGDSNVHNMMDRLKLHYEKNILYFTRAKAYIFYPTVANQIATPSHFDIMTFVLRSLGFQPKCRSYGVMENLFRRGQGTVSVLMNGRAGLDFPDVFLEDVLFQDLEDPDNSKKENEE